MNGRRRAARGHVAGQAAHALTMMHGRRLDLASAKRYPQTWRGLPKSFGMDPPGRRAGFDHWRTLHRALVARLEPLP